MLAKATVEAVGIGLVEGCQLLGKVGRLRGAGDLCAVGVDEGDGEGAGGDSAIEAHVEVVRKPIVGLRR